MLEALSINMVEDNGWGSRRKVKNYFLPQTSSYLPARSVSAKAGANLKPQTILCHALYEVYDEPRLPCP
jgi:hypothetical protein